jgi:protein CpxP
MKALSKILLASLLTIAFLSPAMADEKMMDKKAQDCEGGATVKLGQMGTVDEAALQKHIDVMKLQMKNIRHGRGSHGSRKLALKKHLSEMEAAVQEMNDQKYAAGCKDVMSDASVKTRVEVMEKRMDMMQQMMKQMIENLAEQTK